MPHKFTHADGQRLAGVWLTHKLRRYCAWQFEPGTSTLKASRGVSVHTATLDGKTRTVEELREELPQMALRLAMESRLAG